VLSGGVDVVVASGVASATVLSRGAEWVASGGLAVGATVSSGGTQTVFTGGLASGTVVSSQGSLIVSAGGVARNAAVLSGGALIDNGKLLVSDGRTLAGSLSGSGWIAETGHNTLVLADSGAGFAGRAIISHGVIELATATAIGSGAVVFAAPPAVEAVLRVDAADSPIAGGTFANLLSNFDGGGEGLDLRGVAFHTGAKAVVSGAVLTLSEGGKTYNFKLGGGMAASYQVTNDGGGGTLINPLAAALAHRMAAFRAVDAASPTLGVEGAPVTAGCLGLAPLQDGRNGAANPG
jgi:autotransporter passenger strand-loop-strand repeat protein